MDDDDDDYMVLGDTKGCKGIGMRKKLLLFKLLIEAGIVLCDVSE